MRGSSQEASSSYCAEFDGRKSNPGHILGCMVGLGLWFLKRNRGGNHFEMTTEQKRTQHQKGLVGQVGKATLLSATT